MRHPNVFVRINCGGRGSAECILSVDMDDAQGDAGLSSQRGKVVMIAPRPDGEVTVDCPSWEESLGCRERLTARGSIMRQDSGKYVLILNGKTDELGSFTCVGELDLEQDGEPTGAHGSAVVKLHRGGFIAGRVAICETPEGGQVFNLQPVPSISFSDGTTVNASTELGDLSGADLSFNLSFQRSYTEGLLTLIAE